MQIKFYGHQSGRALTPANPLDMCINLKGGASYTNDHDYYIRTKGERLLEGIPINLQYITKTVLISAAQRQIYAVYDDKKYEPKFTKVNEDTIALEFIPCR